MHDDRHDHQNDRQDRDAGPFAAAKRRDRHAGQEAALGQPGEVRLGEHADRFAPGHQQEGDAAERGQGAEGGDGRVDPELGDDQAVDHARQRTGDDPGQHRDEHVAEWA